MGVPSTCTIVAGKNTKKVAVGRLEKDARGLRQVIECPIQNGCLDRAQSTMGASEAALSIMGRRAKP
jgi:hypothetical protein